MFFFKLLCVFILPHFILGISIASKTNFDDATPIAGTDQSEIESRSVELVLRGSKHGNKTKTRDYIPVVLKRNDRKIEARIPIVVEKEVARIYRGKSSATERPVPIVRGAVVPLRSDLLDLPSSIIEGLDPPKAAAQDEWRYAQSTDGNSKYPNSNGYYPIVGGGYTTSPRPVYGVPTQSPNNGWGCQAVPWSGNGYPPTSNKPGSYYPQPGYSPSQGEYPNQGNPNYNLNQGNPNYNPNQGNNPNYMPNQGNYPSYSPQNQYPSSPGNYPSYSPSQGGNPNMGWSGSSQWQQQPSWQADTNRPWIGKERGRWVPCEPYDLTSTDGRSKSARCPQFSRSSNTVRFETATPASKIEDKLLHNSLPKDVEEVTP